MHEQPPQADRLDTEKLGERTLREWHRWLCTNHETGEDESGAWVLSKYGHTTDEASWWAVAAEVAYEEACGPAGTETAAGMAYMMSLVVNDHPDVLDLVREHSYAIPVELLNLLDWEEQV